jgi:hypothetical protein
MPISGYQILWMCCNSFRLFVSKHAGVGGAGGGGGADRNLISVKLFKKLKSMRISFLLKWRKKYFFHVNFFPTFSTDSKSASNPACFVTYLKLFRFLLVSYNISTFLQTLKQNEHETVSKKRKSKFSKVS